MDKALEKISVGQPVKWGGVSGNHHVGVKSVSLVDGDSNIILL